MNFIISFFCILVTSIIANSLLNSFRCANSVKNERERVILLKIILTVGILLALLCVGFIIIGYAILD